MLDAVWIGVGFGCIILPFLFCWAAVFNCFIPGEVVIATVVRVSVKHRRAGRVTVTGRKQHWTRSENYVRIEYVDGIGNRRLADSVLPDFTERIVPGDKVKVLSDRKGHTKMLLLSGPLQEGI